MTPGHQKWDGKIDAFASHFLASYANRWYSQRRNVRLSVRLSVCPSVRHTLVLHQNEESLRHDFFTIREPEHSTFYKYLVHHEIR